MKNINQEHTGRKRIALVSGKFLSLSLLRDTTVLS